MLHDAIGVAMEGALSSLASQLMANGICLSKQDQKARQAATYASHIATSLASLLHGAAARQQTSRTPPHHAALKDVAALQAAMPGANDDRAGWFDCT